MNKLLITLPLLLFSLFTFAQYKGGLELGGNLMSADLVLSDPVETSTTWGIRIGYVAEYRLSPTFYATSALLINQRGFQAAEERWGLNAIDLPVNIGLSFPIGENGRNIFLDTGLNFAYNFRAFTKIDGELTTLSIGKEEDDIKPFSNGFNIGTGLSLNDGIKIRFNYYKGFTNLLRTTGDEWKNQTFSLSFHFYFNQK